MKLIGSGLSPYVQRVLLAARHKDLPLLLEPPQTASRDAGHLAINPMGKIPVLVDGKLTLPESSVIVEYLEDRFPSPSLLPQSPVARAQARLLTRILDTYGPPSFGAFLENDSAGIAVAMLQIKNCLSYLDHFWPQAEDTTVHRFAAGDSFSVADCSLIPFFCIFDRLQDNFATMDCVRQHAPIDTWWNSARLSDAGKFAGETLDKAIASLLATPASP